MSKPIIAVVGGTGAQGGGVVDALLDRGQFAVRVLTRDATSERAQALTVRGVHVVSANLNDASSLRSAFAGAHGVFLVTNFWDPSSGMSEAQQATGAIEAAKVAGVKHLVWSTLPDAKRLSEGRLGVEHFTGKAVVDRLVTEAGFEHHTFVEAPMYFQNFTAMMTPQPLGDGKTGWAVPMDVTKRCIHAGDVTDVGKVVARVFEDPKRAGDGRHLGVATGLVSWNDLVSSLNALGHSYSVVQVPAEVYDGFYPGAQEMREMFQWFEGYTYFGPDADSKLANTRAVYPHKLKTFTTWATAHMPVHTP